MTLNNDEENKYSLYAQRAINWQKPVIH